MRHSSPTPAPISVSRTLVAVGVVAGTLAGVALSQQARVFSSSETSAVPPSADVSLIQTASAAAGLNFSSPSSKRPAPTACGSTLITPPQPSRASECILAPLGVDIVPFPEPQGPDTAHVTSPAVFSDTQLRPATPAVSRLTAHGAAGFFNVSPVDRQIPSLSSLATAARTRQGILLTPAGFPYADEIGVIAEAAAANGIQSVEDWYILLAIRCAENGRPGREFGVLAPRAVDTNLRTQAGWAAATVLKNRYRYQTALEAGLGAGREVCPADRRVDSRRPAAPDAAAFIEFLAGRYCPAACDPVGHENWKKNVSYYYRQFTAEFK